MEWKFLMQAGRAPMIGSAVLALWLPVTVMADTAAEPLCTREGVLDRKCLAIKKAQSDSEVERLYRRIHASLKSQWEAVKDQPESVPSPEWHQKRLQFLEANHRRWQAYRDSLCAARSHEFWPGSMALPESMSCAMEQNTERLKSLQRIYPEGEAPR